MVWRVCKSTRQIFLLSLFNFWVTKLQCIATRIWWGTECGYFRIFTIILDAAISAVKELHIFYISARGKNGICLFLSTERQYGDLVFLCWCHGTKDEPMCLFLWKNVFLTCLRRERLLHTRCTCFLFILLLYAYALLLWVWVGWTMTKMINHWQWCEHITASQTQTLPLSFNGGVSD